MYDPVAHVVLYQPEIPHNTGSVGRTCVAIGAKLWLVRPLGFRLDDYYLRRAGLDYWQHLVWEAVDNWEALVEKLLSPARPVEQRATSGSPRNWAKNVFRKCSGNWQRSISARQWWLFTKRGRRRYAEVCYRPGDVFVFGCESAGLPNSILDRFPDRQLRIPIRSEARSLNLSNSVAVALFEAARQNGWAP